MPNPNRKHVTRTPLGMLAVILAVLCLTAAPFLAFARSDAAAGGFAAAGGLCLVAAAIAEAGANAPRPPEGGA